MKQRLFEIWRISMPFSTSVAIGQVLAYAIGFKDERKIVDVERIDLKTVTRNTSNTIYCATCMMELKERTCLRMQCVTKNNKHFQAFVHDACYSKKVASILAMLEPRPVPIK